MSNTKKTIVIGKKSNKEKTKVKVLDKDKSIETEENNKNKVDKKEKDVIVNAIDYLDKLINTPEEKLKDALVIIKAKVPPTMLLKNPHLGTRSNYYSPLMAELMIQSRLVDLIRSCDNPNDPSVEKFIQKTMDEYDLPFKEGELEKIRSKSNSNDKNNKKDNKKSNLESINVDELIDQVEKDDKKKKKNKEQDNKQEKEKNEKKLSKKDKKKVV